MSISTPPRASPSCSARPERARPRCSIALPDSSSRTPAASRSAIALCSTPQRDIRSAGRETQHRLRFSGPRIVPALDRRRKCGVWPVTPCRAQNAISVPPQFSTHSAFRIWRAAVPARFPAENASAWHWRVLWSPIRSCCCWTNRWPRSTRHQSPNHRRSARLERGAPHPHSLCHAQPGRSVCPRRRACWCLTTDASWRRARRTKC